LDSKSSRSPIVKGTNLKRTLFVEDEESIRLRKQKTDSRDALHILDLLLTDRFPQIWIPAPAVG
jgi:hypothetical protein